MDDFEAVLGDAEKAVRRGVIGGVRGACRSLLSDSRDLVPYDQGDLSRSGAVSMNTAGSEVEGAVTYDTPYAVIQHEAEDYRHQDGRTSHYLGGPLRANSDRYMAHIQAEVAKELQGG
ncbi:hypothetical protein [Kibdelosporangium phytohabitans]|uniref:HK97 gp10 family phage protein n=1 Tax=Kibdelosporangium phytohabitans TaxID=860235 RepID=A0A0N9HX12_9PSEU|nr:hypothetical protein [Kibdelosporangium phytohabitans]ALG07669.1 hypothetical protein AOZ06_12800 [Kibdelosporangium phytohabitans]ALG07725.1 hypothetical protein AOZ06_13120 [Kibdelosporangium phytohabitans]MBE1471371.1 hypothetical protein [Kibdelosporangium phytohabitans]